MTLGWGGGLRASQEGDSRRWHLGWGAAGGGAAYGAGVGSTGFSRWGGANTGPEHHGLHFGFTVAIFRVHRDDRMLCRVRPGGEEARAGQGGRRDQL